MSVDEHAEDLVALAVARDFQVDGDFDCVIFVGDVPELSNENMICQYCEMVRRDAETLDG